jgi:putative two-component system response regulator
MIYRKVLVVDDEPCNLDLLGEVLKEDYILSFARNGEEALALAANIRPALVLLDICMPGMDGYEVCRRLKSDAATAKIPVIFITAINNIQSEQAGFEAGCVDFLSKPISPPIVLARVRTHLSLVRAADLENSYRDAVYMLGQAGHYNDTDTGVHIWRMGAYSRIIAEQAGWNKDWAALLELAAPLHDTGKIGIPDAILKKPSALNAEEWAIMKTHTVIGHHILMKSQAPVFQLAAEIALHHHEKWDGSGYPDGLVGTAIPESARIIAIADVFDALSMKRPYKDAWELPLILDSMRKASGQHFDPTLMQAFEAGLPQILTIKAEWRGREHEVNATFSLRE